jgi:hypothetical protein
MIDHNSAGFLQIKSRGVQCTRGLFATICRLSVAPTAIPYYSPMSCNHLQIIFRKGSMQVQLVCPALHDACTTIGQGEMLPCFYLRPTTMLQLTFFFCSSTTIEPRRSSCGMQSLSSDRTGESSGVFLSLVFVLTYSEKLPGSG